MYIKIILLPLLTFLFFACDINTTGDSSNKDVPINAQINLTNDPKIGIEQDDGDIIKIKPKYDLKLAPLIVKIVQSGTSISIESKTNIKNILPKTIDDIESKKLNLNNLLSTIKQIYKNISYKFESQEINKLTVVKLSYNFLQEEYRLTKNGEWQSFKDLNDAVYALNNSIYLITLNKKDLKNGGIFEGNTKLEINVLKLPKPFQLDILSGSKNITISSELNFRFEVSI